MPRAGISDYVEDKTNRISTTSTYRTAMVGAAKKGPVDTPYLCTGQTNFLSKFTPNETIELGWDTALFEAWQYLKTQQNLYFVRAISRDALYGGCSIRTFKSEKEHAPFSKGLGLDEDPELDYENDALVLVGADPGDYNNDISVSIITDPDEVKLDGCFIIRVYKNNNKVEDHVCSLDPKYKNGYGVNCFAENVLNASNYIRAFVNDETDNITAESYSLKVVGTVNFTNKTIAVKTSILRDHAYKLGDIVKCTDITKKTGFYECTLAGTSAHEKPSFSDDETNYKKEVVDGTCTWKLKEVIVPYAKETSFNAGDIVTITKTKTMNFRAKTSGTTGLTEPTWINGDTPLVVVQDGSVTWVNQDQTQEISIVNCYTYKEGEKDSKLDLSRYTAYSDLYLVTEANLPKTSIVEDPTLLEAQNVEKEVTYTAIYTGEASTKHYILPKQSKKENGTYARTSLAGGFDGSAVTDADRIRALNTLRSTKDYTFQLIMDGGNTTPAYQRAISDICDVRLDSCHGIISVPYECGQGMISGDPLTDTLDYRKDRLNANTANLELYTTHQLVYDEFNDRNMYISPGCFVAATIMDVAQTYGWHYTTAGQNRGVINSLDTAIAYEDEILNSFCDNQINPIIKEPGIGQVIGDDYTLLSTACDMQDAHISRYVNIYLRPRVRDALKTFLFEFNDDETRKTVTKMLETFVLPEVSSRAIQDYKIICDTTNNTPRDIQNSTCNVWIFLQPTHIIRWMRIGYILTQNGVQDAGVSY